MNNGQRNAKFLAVVDAPSKMLILINIAAQYGIAPAQVIEEVTHDAAEHILDYMTEPARSAASVLMQRHGLRGF